MHSLVLHPDCTAGAISRITADIRPTANGCDAEFRLEGRIADILVPRSEMGVRRDFLWKTTCFEIFWQPAGGTYYREFNLSPSGCWAAYDFDDFRENSRDAPVDAIALACSHDDNALVLKASIAAALPTPADVALNAIVEQPDGNLQFWALAFEEGKPEFHSTVCRKLRVERA